MDYVINCETGREIGQPRNQIDPCDWNLDAVARLAAAAVLCERAVERDLLCACREGEVCRLIGQRGVDSQTNRSPELRRVLNRPVRVTALPNAIVEAVGRKFGTV